MPWFARIISLLGVACLLTLSLQAACASASSSPELTDFIGAGGYMLTGTDGRQIYSNELATQQFTGSKISTDLENAFASTAYWAKPTCNANPFLGLTSFTMEGWFRWNELERGEWSLLSLELQGTE